jgi:hypothetical protein
MIATIEIHSKIQKSIKQKACTFNFKPQNNTRKNPPTIHYIKTHEQRPTFPSLQENDNVLQVSILQDDSGYFGANG